MKNKLLFAALLLGVVCKGFSQIDTTVLKFGTWQSFSGPLNKQTYPEIRGRLCNFYWQDVEPAPDVWTWASFDNELSIRTADSLPVIFMIYTKEDAPDWLFQNGVPKVNEKDANGVVTGYSPYYKDPDYKFFFKRMVTKLRQHIDTLPLSIRKYIVGVQGCFGSTGDFISYKGTVSSQYEITPTEFEDLFKEFTTHYYTEFNNTNPKITLLTNPQNNGYAELNWLMQNCPGGWIKNGTLGKGYQMNDETVKADSMFALLNSPQGGQYLRSRSETYTPLTLPPWFYINPARNFFTTITYMIHWGMDWSNQHADFITDPLYENANLFYNRYAGKKNPLTSTNAVCALRDGLDGADITRFPVNNYGPYSRTDTNRYRLIANAFAPKGARLDDPIKATLNEQDNLDANGLNDVGWNIFPGNYERYLKQINANGTSIGYWNVNAVNEPNAMYGRFARGFDIANGKDALYFNAEDAFLNNAPIDSQYVITLTVTYLDKGYGSFKICYDSKTGGVNKKAVDVTCNNSQTWKQVSILVKDAYFGNRSDNGSDFYIKNTGAEDIIFALAEFSRPLPDGSDLGFYVKPLPSFGTICYTAAIGPIVFQLDANFLDGTNTVVGPLNGFKFSTSPTGSFNDSVVIGNYGTTFHKNIYIKFQPSAAGNYSGNIPVKGGGASLYQIPVSATAVASSPTISANVLNVSCTGQKDGSIDVSISGGTGPHSYEWTHSETNFFATTQDISVLKPGDYYLKLTSYAGCTQNRTYAILDPSPLSVTIIQDSNITCKGGNTTVKVNGSGGTPAYTGTGTFTVSAGVKPFTVYDSRGCSRIERITIEQGTLDIPLKPTTLVSTDATAKGICNGGNFNFSTNSVNTATYYSWTLPTGGTIVSQQNNGLSIVANLISTGSSKNISVKSGNVCGTSINYTKTFSHLPDNPSAISGPSVVQQNQQGVAFSVTNVSGVTYVWKFPKNVVITSGNNTSSVVVNWSTFSGSITVKAKNNCGTSGVSKKTVSFGSALRSNEQSADIINKEAQLVIAPNPVKDVLRAYLSNGAVVNNIYVYNVDGKLLYMQKLNTTVIIIAKKQMNIQPGIYFIDVTAGEKHYRQKFLAE